MTIKKTTSRTFIVGRGPLNYFLDLKSNLKFDKWKGVIIAIVILFSFSKSLNAQNTYTYSLIDADNDAVLISSFNEDITWNLNDASGLNVISDLDNYSEASKVRFTTSERTHTEGAIPFAYYGDYFGDYGEANNTYYGWQPTVGTLDFLVEYLDTDLNVIVSDSFSITFIDTTPDTQVPSAPTSLTGTASSTTTVALSWNAATDNIGVTGYKVYQDNVEIATNWAGTTYDVNGLSPATSYDFKVQAVDAAGNESANSNTLTVTTNASSGGGSSGTSVWAESNTTASYNGEVAIGRSTVPGGYKLAVEGFIRAREIRVDQESWPDYVFKEGYDLPTLAEIQKHIKEKGHLPNIPSATEVEANGVQLGEMNRLLLEKIEELTLYILQQQSEINSLKKEIIKIKK